MVRSSLLSILLICLAASSVYAQDCLLADNCASCTLDTFCASCESGYGLYEGECYSCPTLCSSCSASPDGGSQVETSCSGLYWYLYVIIVAVVVSLIGCCCCCCRNCCGEQNAQVIQKQPEQRVMNVHFSGYGQQQAQMQQLHQGWNSNGQGFNQPQPNRPNVQF